MSRPIIVKHKALKTNESYLKIDKAKVELFSLLRLIKSFSSIEKREFKTIFGKRKGNKGYLKLFDVLNKISKGGFDDDNLEPMVIKRLRIDNKEFYRLKTELKSNLFKFLSKRSKLPQKRIFSLYLSALELRERRNYPLAKTAIIEGKELAQLWEENELWKQLIELEFQLPRRFQSPSLNAELEQVEELGNEFMTLNSILDRIKEWPKDKATSAPRIKLLDQLSSHSALSLTKTYRQDRSKALYLLSKRRLSSLNSKWNQARILSDQYIALVEDSIVFQFEREGSILDELVQLSNSFELSGNEKGFWDTLQRIRKIKPVSAIGKLKAFRAYYEPLIWRVADYGDLETGKKLVPLIRNSIEELGYELEDKHKIYFAFHCARFQFVAGDYKDALAWVRFLLEQKEAGAAFELFFPYASLIEVLCHCELGNPTLVDFLALSIKRRMSKESPFPEYFSLVTSCIKIVSDNNPSQARKKLVRKLTELEKLSQQYTDDYQPFNFLNPIPWAKSKTSRVPLAMVLQKEQSEKKYPTWEDQEQELG